MSYNNLTIEQIKENFDTQNTLANTARQDLGACTCETARPYIQSALDKAEANVVALRAAFLDAANSY